MYASLQYARAANLSHSHTLLLNQGTIDCAPPPGDHQQQQAQHRTCYPQVPRQYSDNDFDEQPQQQQQQQQYDDDNDSGSIDACTPLTAGGNYDCNGSNGKRKLRHKFTTSGRLQLGRSTTALTASAAAATYASSAAPAPAPAATTATLVPAASAAATVAAVIPLLAPSVGNFASNSNETSNSANIGGSNVLPATTPTHDYSLCDSCRPLRFHSQLKGGGSSSSHTSGYLSHSGAFSADIAPAGRSSYGTARLLSYAASTLPHSHSHSASNSSSSSNRYSGTPTPSASAAAGPPTFQQLPQPAVASLLYSSSAIAAAAAPAHISQYQLRSLHLQQQQQQHQQQLYNFHNNRFQQHRRTASRSMSQSGEDLHSPSYLSWRKLQLSRAKLKASSKTSALLSGFAMVAMVEVQLNNDTQVPPGMLVAFAICTTLLVAVHMLALMISTCILPNIETVCNLHSISLVHESPHERLQWYIETAWAFSTVLGLILFLLEIAILCWVKFYDLSQPAAWSACIVLIPVLVVFLAFAIHFYQSLVTHKYEVTVSGIRELEMLKEQMEQDHMDHHPHAHTTHGGGSHRSNNGLSYSASGEIV